MYIWLHCYKCIVNYVIWTHRMIVQYPCRHNTVRVWIQNSCQTRSILDGHVDLVSEGEPPPTLMRKERQKRKRWGRKSIDLWETKKKEMMRMRKKKKQRSKPLAVRVENMRLRKRQKRQREDDGEERRRSQP